MNDKRTKVVERPAAAVWGITKALTRVDIRRLLHDWHCADEDDPDAVIATRGSTQIVVDLHGDWVVSAVVTRRGKYAGTTRRGCPQIVIPAALQFAKG